jgi:uncharacterized membrane protein
MPKYEFKKIKDPENQFDITNVSIEVESESMNDVIEAFEEFLAACGFIFDRTKKNLDITDIE